MLIWEGISALDNVTPIRLILTDRSRNRKTGDMLQTWIMRSDVAPHDAVREGEDAPICGSCPFRSGAGCYVAVHQGPLSTWKAHKDATIATVREIKAAHAGKALRIGAYGDPAAVPLTVWRALIRLIQPHTWTGYTHAWQSAPKGFRSLLMASVESPEQAAQAHAMGWRTFRVAPDAAPIGREIACVNTTRGVSCVDCGLCDGARPNDRRKSIVIEAHGPKAGRIAW
jgi:hypothetical protein